MRILVCYAIDMNNTEFLINDRIIVVTGSLKNQTGDIKILDGTRAYVSFFEVGIGNVWIPLKNMQLR